MRTAENDGCTKSPDLWPFAACCALHDYYYRRGIHPVDGLPVTRTQADAALRDCMRERSKLGAYSPVAMAYWVGVRLFGRGFKYGRFKDVENS